MLDPAPPRHFLLLDGMRGIAALAVLVLHASQTHGFTWAPMHAALAVDFFFCLSGFVLACAYDARIGHDIDAGRFMTLRLVRLYPMLALGMVLGWASLAAFPTTIAVTPPVGMVPPPVAFYGVTGLLMLPAGLLFENEVYPVNNPSWSLFFELAASLGYALLLARVSNRRLGVVAALVAVPLVFAIWKVGGIQQIGWIGVKSFFAGFARVAFPFICGVLAWRTGLHRRMPRWPALVPAGLLAVLTFQPFAVHPLYDVLAIGLLPVLVALGAASPVGGRTAKVAARIGALSYPLYLVHLPVIRAVLGATADSTVPLEARFAICVALSIALGFAAEALYDRPVRAALGAWLRRRRLARTVAPVEVARPPAPKPAPAAGVDVG